MVAAGLRARRTHAGTGACTHQKRASPFQRTWVNRRFMITVDFRAGVGAIRESPDARCRRETPLRAVPELPLHHEPNCSTERPILVLSSAGGGSGPAEKTPTAGPMEGNPGRNPVSSRT